MKPILLNTLVGDNVITEEVIVNVPDEFKEGHDTMSIKLTNFINKQFDCIIGINILYPFGAVIDFQNNLLRVNNNEMRLIDAHFDISYDDIHCLEIFELNKLKDLVPENLNSEESRLLKYFLNGNKKSFYIEGRNLTATNCVRHRIITTSNKAVNCKNYRHPQVLEDEIECQIDEMLRQNIIRPSKSPYNSPLWIVEKKSNGANQRKWR